MYTGPVLCLTLKEYIVWQYPLDLLCKTFSVLNLLLFVMILLVVVCLIMSLFVEMFICLFPVVLTPWGADLFHLLCVYIAGTLGMLIITKSCWWVGYSAVEWPNSADETSQTVKSAFPASDRSAHNVENGCCCSEGHWTWKEHLPLLPRGKKNSRRKHTWFLGASLPLAMTLIDSLTLFVLHFLHLRTRNNKICALY